jgi:hypothetical protein
MPCGFQLLHGLLLQLFVSFLTFLDTRLHFVHVQAHVDRGGSLKQSRQEGWWVTSLDGRLAPG